MKYIFYINISKKQLKTLLFHSFIFILIDPIQSHENFRKPYPKYYAGHFLEDGYGS